MKKIDELMHDLDVSVEKNVTPVWNHHLKKYFALFSTTVLTLLIAVSIFKVFNSKADVLTTALIEDLAKIEKIMQSIDARCKILGIRGQRSPVDFLTVQKFAGSTVGCLNLSYPRKWKGPYLKQNPSVQGILYEIIKTKEGYFVVPGAGVQLPNKLIMGKDIVLTDESSITTMTQLNGRLSYQGNPLAIRLTFKIADFASDPAVPTTGEKIGNMLKEFNEALPFAQLENGIVQHMIC
jgi:hypothetical protein